MTISAKKSSYSSNYFFLTKKLNSWFSFRMSEVHENQYYELVQEKAMMQILALQIAKLFNLEEKRNPMKV